MHAHTHTHTHTHTHAHNSQFLEVILQIQQRIARSDRQVLNLVSSQECCHSHYTLLAATAHPDHHDVARFPLDKTCHSTHVGGALSEEYQMHDWVLRVIVLW